MGRPVRQGSITPDPGLRELFPQTQIKIQGKFYFTPTNCVVHPHALTYFSMYI